MDRRPDRKLLASYEKHGLLDWYYDFEQFFFNYNDDLDLVRFGMDSDIHLHDWVATLEQFFEDYSTVYYFKQDYAKVMFAMLFLQWDLRRMIWDWCLSYPDLEWASFKMELQRETGAYLAIEATTKEDIQDPDVGLQDEVVLQDHDHFNDEECGIKLPYFKLDGSIFFDDWLASMLAYFEEYDLIEYHKLCLGVQQLEGSLQSWAREWCQNTYRPNWDLFTLALHQHIEVHIPNQSTHLEREAKHEETKEDEVKFTLDQHDEIPLLEGVNIKLSPSAFILQEHLGSYICGNLYYYTMNPHFFGFYSQMKDSLFSKRHRHLCGLMHLCWTPTSSTMVSLHHHLDQTTTYDILAVAGGGHIYLY